ncbi:MAG: hypothetical protein SF028_12680 [Candidatus Sumerlaeia bacterium]|nr:hypothetical protein [Candidatus Sumerlaeia bacterium]
MNEPLLRQHLVPNLFEPSDYFELDVRGGVMRNRFGAKCCSLSGHFLRGLYIALQHEAGPAWRAILKSCGESWGAKYAQRFVRETGQFYSQSLDEMPMARFDALLRENFATHGWGRLAPDYSRLNAGVIVVEVANPVLTEALGIAEPRVEVLLEGVLKALYSEVTGQPLECVETAAAAQGAPASLFLLAHKDRMKDAARMADDGKPHADILAHVLAVKPAAA